MAHRVQPCPECPPTRVLGYANDQLVASALERHLHRITAGRHDAQIVTQPLGVHAEIERTPVQVDRDPMTLSASTSPVAESTGTVATGATRWRRTGCCHGRPTPFFFRWWTVTSVPALGALRLPPGRTRARLTRPGRAEADRTTMNRSRLRAAAVVAVARNGHARATVVPRGPSERRRTSGRRRSWRRSRSGCRRRSSAPV